MDSFVSRASAHRRTAADAPTAADVARKSMRSSAPSTRRSDQPVQRSISYGIVTVLAAGVRHGAATERGENAETAQVAWFRRAQQQGGSAAA